MGGHPVQNALRLCACTGYPLVHHLKTMVTALKNMILKNVFPAREMTSAGAYDLWAKSYDNQHGNLLMDMDEAIVAQLLSEVTITNKQIADIGCGTGRHWPKLFRQHPAGITGFDVSAGMLDRLHQKFPTAHTRQIKNDLFNGVATAGYDVILSTLTVGYIENIGEALQAWSRILKPRGDIIITDFHPNALAFGGNRTFEHNNRQIAIKNFVHYVSDIEEILLQNNFRVVNKIEHSVGESVKHYYTAKNALHVYEKFKDSRIIYGIHLRRGYDTE
jgi:ubiquinone/menaquinone biosynthesis C-methylase UbiE